MKHIYTLIILFACSTFFIAQNVNEERKIVDQDNSYEVYLKYRLTDQEKPNAINDVTEILGASVGDNNWVTEKSSEKFVTVKMINGYLFVRGYDHTENQELRPKLKALDTKLRVYSDSDKD